MIKEEGTAWNIYSAGQRREERGEKGRVTIKWIKWGVSQRAGGGCRRNGLGTFRFLGSCPAANQRPLFTKSLPTSQRSPFSASIDHFQPVASSLRVPLGRMGG